ncbi:MAG: glycerol acyltransferase, partial [Flavobacteriales bacterium]
FIRPRKRFAFEEKRLDTDALLEAADGDVKRLDRILADIEPSEAVMPVLLKKYLHQNARILGFNRDPKFNNALDGLMLLDVQDLPAQTV